MIAQEFVYASLLSTKFPRVAHAKGRKIEKAAGGGFKTICGHPLGAMLSNTEIRAGRRCEQCFIQGQGVKFFKEAAKVLTTPVARKERAVYPGLLVQNSRHVRRQLDKFAENYPDFSVWALQQARYLKAGLEEIGAAE